MLKHARTTTTLALTLVACLIGSIVLLAEPQEPLKPQKIVNTSVFMRAKLAGSKRVMEGLVTEDFALIRDAATEMKAMSEHAEWPRSRDQIYEHYSEEFRRQCNQLASLADKRNREGAHFTFLSVTTTCVNCHNYVRGSFRVARDRSNPSQPVQLIPSEWNESREGHETPVGKNLR